jgi:gluconolactonase
MHDALEERTSGKEWLMTLADFVLSVDSLRRWGTDLARPENVLAFRDGTVFASSNRGHVTRIGPDGRQWLIGDLPGKQPTTMALESEEALLVNNTADGCLYRLFLDGRHELVLDTIEGEPIGSANYVFRDSRNRIWIAVGARRRPPHKTLRVLPDGYIAILEQGRARVVGDGICWPNEVRLDAEEEHAYVSETFGGRVLRYDVAEDGTLSNKTVFGPDSLGFAALPDGIALDADGNVWVAIVSRNGLMVITADGDAHVVFEEPVEDALEQLAPAYASGEIPPALMVACAGSKLRLLTSVGFGGLDLQTVFMGSLGMSELVSFDSPVPGLPLFHQRSASAPPQPELVVTPSEVSP